MPRLAIAILELKILLAKVSEETSPVFDLTESAGLQLVSTYHFELADPALRFGASRANISRPFRLDAPQLGRTMPLKLTLVPAVTAASRK